MNKYEKALNSIAMQSELGKFDYEIGCILELIERATAKKIKYKVFMKNTDMEEYIPQCPRCGKTNYDLLHLKYKFCPNCGQALDWSD